MKAKSFKQKFLALTFFSYEGERGSHWLRGVQIWEGDCLVVGLGVEEFEVFLSFFLFFFFNLVKS